MLHLYRSTRRLGAVTTGEKSFLFSGLSNLYIYRMTSGTGMVPYRPRVELALSYTTPAHQRSAGRWGWGFPH